MNKLMCEIDYSNEDYFISWLTQWDEDSEYSTYNAEDVEILTIDNMLFLIPKEGRKPIKLIIA
jgi:hypothetical protein